MLVCILFFYQSQRLLTLRQSCLSLKFNIFTFFCFINVYQKLVQFQIKTLKKTHIIDKYIETHQFFQVNYYLIIFALVVHFMRNYVFDYQPSKLPLFNYFVISNCMTKYFQYVIFFVFSLLSFLQTQQSVYSFLISVFIQIILRVFYQIQFYFTTHTKFWYRYMLNGSITRIFYLS
ncbi:hypothetical protein ABPG74_005646 [Tetrahymena malaccensis]